MIASTTGHVSVRWRAALDQAPAPLGITATQYAVLASLHGLSRGRAAQPARAGGVQRFNGLAPLYVSRLARTLERAGLLRRAESRVDPRAVELSLTERGVEVLRAGVATVHRLEEERLAPPGGRDGARSAKPRGMLLALLRRVEAAEARRPAPPTPDE